MKHLNVEPHRPSPLLRVAFASVGFLGLAVGISIFAWRESTAMMTTSLIALAAIVGGLCFAHPEILRRRTRAWSRAGQGALGILMMIAGVILLVTLGESTLWLGVLVAVLAGALWTIEGAVSLSTWGEPATMRWSLLLALLSVAAGVGILLTPAWLALILWWLLGLSLFVLGIVNVVRAFRFGTHPGR